MVKYEREAVPFRVFIIAKSRRINIFSNSYYVVILTEETGFVIDFIQTSLVKYRPFRGMCNNRQKISIFTCPFTKRNKKQIIYNRILLNKLHEENIIRRYTCTISKEDRPYPCV